MNYTYPLTGTEYALTTVENLKNLTPKELTQEQWNGLIYAIELNIPNSPNKVINSKNGKTHEAYYDLQVTYDSTGLVYNAYWEGIIDPYSGDREGEWLYTIDLILTE